MANFKITPVNRVTGATAPYYLIEAPDKEAAIQEAEQRSRLSDFNNWEFTV